MKYARTFFPIKNQSLIINILPAIELSVKNMENVKFPGHCGKIGTDIILKWE